MPPNADLVAVEEVSVAANDDLSCADVSLADFAGKRFKAAPITQLHFCPLIVSKHLSSISAAAVGAERLLLLSKERRLVVFL